MERKHDLRSQQTLETLNNLQNDGIDKFSLLIRHSARFFTEDAMMEPFMGLTQEGKEYAMEFGRALKAEPGPRLCSSFFGRCIETAYLIDKGYTQKHKTELGHNVTDPTLAPFYIKDIKKAIHKVEAEGTKLFIRNWFDHKIDEDIMENPEKTCDRLCAFMIDQIESLGEHCMSICVSHDWNIYPIKEFKMALPHETYGDVGYLDGIVFFRKQGKYYLTSFQSDPVLL